MASGSRYADVLLPLPLPGYFTYRLPSELEEMTGTGKRVVVQFGKRKIFTALVRRIHDKKPETYDAKDILSVIDEYPLVHEIQFRLWEWMADYYMCTPGEVMNAAIPAGLKLASESVISLNTEADLSSVVLNDREELVVEALLAQKKLDVSTIAHIVDLQKIIPLLNNLIEKGLITTQEQLVERYRPKMETCVRMHLTYRENEELLRDVFDNLGKRAFRQLQLLMSYINLSRNLYQREVEVRKADLLKSIGASPEALNTLVKKGILELYEKEASRLNAEDASASPDDIILSDHQQKAIDNISQQLQEKEVVLLHGVTSSGKTEIYIKLINETLIEGKQVLYLLPEIALTSQIINRLRKYFGERVGVYHSRHNENEKAEIWYHTLNREVPERTGKYDVILGARSALFMPYVSLGLVIVDEEHDTSYKQYDPAPRYNARDTAVYLAGLHGAKTILGSATPAVESYFNAWRGKYGIVRMTERYGGISMPEILVANIKEETRNRTMKSHFSSLLLNHIANALKNKEQVILFQNRRGFSLHLECDACAWIPMCKNCDISLTYHKKEDHLKCHYCGYSVRIPDKCPQCGSARVLMKGFGTEKVEEELGILFPETNIRRMDLDATRTKHAHSRIIAEFEERKIDVLVGTQMVTKGLDFDNVSLVGILNADNMIRFPDFRSHERSFQLMAQVSGRAGRKGKQGRVIIQTYDPDHEIIRFVKENDFQGMYNAQLNDRNKFHYPPYHRLILIKLKHRDHNLLNQAAKEFADNLRIIFGKRILGPEYPLVSRIKNLYIKQVMIKVERQTPPGPIKHELMKKVDEFQKNQKFRQVRVVIDVDPL